jgi:hypothetical protein
MILGLIMLTHKRRQLLQIGLSSSKPRNDAFARQCHGLAADTIIHKARGTIRFRHAKVVGDILAGA